MGQTEKYGDNARLACATLKNCKNARLDSWQRGRFVSDVADKMSGTSRRRQRHISPPPPRKIRIAILIFKGAFCAFEPSQQRGVQNAPHVKRVQRQIDARNCVAGITPSHSTVIHHKRASRYVVLGEILLSPFTTYIFT